MAKIWAPLLGSSSFEDDVK